MGTLAICWALTHADIRPQFTTLASSESVRANVLSVHPVFDSIEAERNKNMFYFLFKVLQAFKTFSVSLSPINLKW